MMASESAGMLASGKITPQKCLNMKHPYEHQDEAMMSLDRMEKKSPSYSTLVVLPTGGGKTYTAATWLLRTALDRKKKVLWMAHRHLLLDQAAASFRQYAYESVIPHIDSFQYRVVSGAANHDRVANITPEDDLLIISKDSIAQHPSCLDEWLEGVRELYCIVDEAHHSTAKSYRKAIEYLQSKIPELKLIGLTATPFRKDIDDPGLLGEIYRDDIVYQIGLNALIARRILATPYFNDCPTSQDYGQELGLRALESIQRSDQIPDEIAGQMAKSVARNQCIVDAYLANKKMYGQTIVFAINVIHAVQLAGAFLDAGIKADYIVSGVRDSSTGAITKTSENEEKLEAYRRGELKVLISVNILTEGVDLPSTKTVFLTRPTVSAVLMTQMVGRALRGVKAGGTSDAHIVCFIDNWGSRIAWVNPQSLFQGLRDSEDEVENRAKSTIRTIAVAKIEEFARMLDESVDTTDLERLPFCERIPQKVYFIRLEEQGEDGADIFYQVIVYNNSVEAYNQLMEDLPVLFDSYAATEEFLPGNFYRKWSGTAITPTSPGKWCLHISSRMSSTSSNIMRSMAKRRVPTRLTRSTGANWTCRRLPSTSGTTALPGRSAGSTKTRCGRIAMITCSSSFSGRSSISCGRSIWSTPSSRLRSCTPHRIRCAMGTRSWKIFRLRRCGISPRIRSRSCVTRRLRISSAKMDSFAVRSAEPSTRKRYASM